MSFCPTCGKHLLASQAFCPNCGTSVIAAGPQPLTQAPRRTGNVWKFAFIVILIILIGSSAGVLMARHLAVRTAIAHPAPSVGLQSGGYMNPKTGMQVTIERLVTNRQGDAATRPDPGKVFVLLDLGFTNRGKSPRSIDRLDFQLLDQSGQTADTTSFFPSTYPPLVAVEIPAGEQRSGWIGFEVPASTRAVVLTWSDQNSLRPPVQVGRYVLTRSAGGKRPAAQLPPDFSSIVAAVQYYQYILHQAYGPGYAVSSLSEVAADVAYQAVTCTASTLANRNSYLTYANVQDQFQAVTQQGLRATAVVHLSQNITTNFTDGSPSKTFAADYTATFSLSNNGLGWRVSNYSWIGSDGSTGDAVKDSQPCLNN